MNCRLIYPFCLCSYLLMKQSKIFDLVILNIQQDIYLKLVYALSLILHLHLARQVILITESISPNDSWPIIPVHTIALERVSENIHISANEPSLAVYRLQEHVRRALPPTVSRRQHVTALHSQLQGACYDVEYALG